MADSTTREMPASLVSSWPTIYFMSMSRFAAEMARRQAIHQYVHATQASNAIILAAALGRR